MSFYINERRKQDKMNYIAEIKAFYDLVQVKQLSTGQIALWNALMYINNKCAWIEWFTVPNILLELNTGMSRSGVLKARNSLKQLGLIDFKANGTKATSYKIHTIAKSTQESNQASTQDGVQVSKQVSTQDSNTLNKLNETKLKKENIKRKYGEYQNVFFTDKQYENLIELFPKDYQERIQKLDDYMQSTGKKYKDCLATLRNWARKDGYDFKKIEKTETKEEEELCFNSSDLTEEQYVAYMQGKLKKEDIRRILEAKNVR